jgi:DNA-binding MarR family transcriptional regulator/RimJ/RimL family protein N-acetyltransferase
MSKQPAHEPSGADRKIDAIRRFNRFYTRQIGLLQEHLATSPLSLTEARVIYELAHQDRTTATRLAQELGLDAGYLSRILRAFQRQGLIEKRASATDGRQALLLLTRRGRRAFEALDAGARSEVTGMLEGLAEDAQARLVAAMSVIEQVLQAQPEARANYLLRPHQPGDLGWIVQRHGAFYAQEYGWNEEFEGLVASIAGKFLREFDPKRERCWIAEKDGENVGSVLLVRRSATIAQLRLLLVDPKARGLGIGARLVDECSRFARLVGYRKIMLWTDSQLHAARSIYEKAGYRLTREEPHHSFGHDLVGQTWTLTL